MCVGAQCHGVTFIWPLTRVSRFLMDMVKTCGLDRFKLSCQKQDFDAQMSKTSKTPQGILSKTG